MDRKPFANKVLVLGIDGMDPDLACHYRAEGIMPNLEKMLTLGAAREDLHMLGSHPTITPPMWTTLACGANPYVHGITDFWRQNPVKLDTFGYALNSELCHAEPLWNVTAEAGLQTLVFHWPGSSWPPTSDDPHLMVVDGTQPEGINMGTGQVEGEYLAICSTQLETTTFKTGVGQVGMMCVIPDLEEADSSSFDKGEFMHFMATAPEISRVNIPDPNSSTMNMGQQVFDLSLSPIKAPVNWSNAPADALETTILFSKGLIHRPALLLKNAEGIYDRLALYRSKKSSEPLITLVKDVFCQDVIDEAIKNDVHYTVNRNMKLVEIAPDGSSLRLWISAATDITDCKVWWPPSLFEEVVQQVGYPQPVSNTGSEDPLLIACMQENWSRTAKWYTDTLLYLIASHDLDVIFTHMHSIDAQEHMFLSCCKEHGPGILPTEDYMEFLRTVYCQADEYIGRFLPLLEEDWTILLISDHGLTVNTVESQPLAGTFIDGGLMVEWGFTALQKDEQGQPIPKIDWAHTKAIQTRMNEIYINMKGKYPTGIVDEQDKWQLEEEIMTALYGLRSPKSGNRVISLAVRNKDAYLFGLGGPECGDIIFFTADDYTQDHGDGLSTATGASHTSQSPIFAACGRGIKQGYTTERIIRETDIAPTVAALLGVRMPAQCEGAPIYQIFTETF